MKKNMELVEERNKVLFLLTFETIDCKLINAYSLHETDLCCSLHGMISA